ncbi:MAG: tellurite resistance TerB family protein [Rhizobiaceae bacterium]
MNIAFSDNWHTSHTEDFLDKVMAGCAIIAFGDGHVSEQETQHMLQLIRRFEPLRCYDIEHLEYSFKRACDDFDHDHIFAEDEALALLLPLRKDIAAAEDLVKTCCAIASIDGHFSQSEKRAAARICATLGLDPAVYKLL